MTTAPARPTLLGPNGQALRTAETEPAGDWKPVRATDNAVVWERPRPAVAAAPVDEGPDPLEQARSDAAQLLDAARAEADHITAEARSLRARTLGSADHDARVIREQAAAEAAQKEEKGKRLDVWMARAVIAGAVGLTATGEYSLARLAHFPREVAWLLPFVIDVYVIQAFRRHRDIVQAIGLTIAANVVYHLAAAGMFGVTTNSHGEHRATWWLIAMVASIASVILWRMHVMTAPPKEEKRRRGSGPDGSTVTVTAAPVAAEMAVPAATAVPSEMAVPAAADGSVEPSVSGSAEVPSSGSPTLTVVPSPTATDSPSNGSAVAVAAPTANPHVSGSDQRKPRHGSAPRGSATAPSGGSGSAQQVAALVALMRRRGSADAVTLADAKKACPGVSERTAARRLETARTMYSKTAK